MTDSESIATEMSEEAYQTFLKESAGLQVDTRGIPSINSRQQAEIDRHKKPEPKFSKPYEYDGDSRRPKVLARTLARMVNEISSNKNDPYRGDVLRALNDVPSDSEGIGVSYFTETETGEEIAIDIQRTRDGWWTAVVNGERHRAQDRDTLLSAISRTLNNNVRELTDAEKRGCSVIAANVGFHSGLIRYLSLRTGLAAAGVWDEFGSLPLDDRKHRLLKEGIELCWLAIRPEFAPGPDWSEFLDRYAHGRNYSVLLLDGARVAYETRAIFQPKANTASEPEPEPAPSYGDLDDLNTGDLNALYQRTAVAHSKRARH